MNFIQLFLWRSGHYRELHHNKYRCSTLLPVLLLLLLFFLHSQLEVLNLLSPAQKAELLMSPYVASLDNGTLALVFHSLLTGESGPSPTAGPGWGPNWTTPGYPPSYPVQLSHQPGLQQVQ